MSSVSIQPYVVGQWVRGEKFYGRSALIDEILHGNRNLLWLLGTRRIGKTSLLKQIEYLTVKNPELGYLPMFWDFQGADDPEEFHMSFSDALLDAEDRLAALGIDVTKVEGDDLFRALTRLRRLVRTKKLKLMLLCDEVEELIKLHQKEPSLLRKLRRALQSTDDIRSVLASTIRLWALADQKEDTSPFLHGFTPPLYIHALSNEEALALVQQSNLPDESRPRFDENAAEIIRTHCDNHPYLIQLVSKRFVELGDLEHSIEQVATDPMVSYFFSVDFEMLTDNEQRIIRMIAERDSSTSETLQDDVAINSHSLTGMLTRLEHLGYIRRNEQRRFVLVNYFFKRWLEERPAAAESSVYDPTSADNLQDLLSLGLNSKTQTIEPNSMPVLFADRYDLLLEAGRGAAGVVYKARDRVLQVEIALKLLRHEISEAPEAIERFRKEIVLTLDVNHPNILPIYHLGESDGRRYLTMKWVDGVTLAQQIADQGPFEIDRVVTISRKLAAALEALHARDVLHRDVKPHNILIDTSDEPYLTDFGLVRLLGHQSTTRDGVFIGTPVYSSPEQASLRELDARSDLYSLGLIMFEMATGRRPFVAESAEQVLELHRTMPAPDPRQLRAEIPADLSGIILRCLEKNPSQRFSSAGAVRAALGARW
jgi:hypothetical protein